MKNIEKGKKGINTCLKLYKSLSGTALSVEELHSILKAHPNQKEEIV